MDKQSLREAIEFLARTTYLRAQGATSEAERQEAVDMAAALERMAAKELGFEFADGLPWNAARTRQATQ